MIFLETKSIIPKKILFIIGAISIIIAFLLGFVLWSQYDRAHAGTSGWSAGRIIDDSIFTNAGSMNVAQIQQFLNTKVTNCDTNGTQPASDFGRPDLTHAQYAATRGWAAPPYPCLKDYSENGLSSAQIIYNAAQQYQINPQVLIVLMQKEQGLVLDSWPLPSEYRSATGYGCPDTAACDSQYYGLTNQLMNAARMYHAIMTASPTWFTPYVLGNNYIQYNPNSSCGGSTVFIQNRATQALYNYTPYQPNQAALDAPMGATVGCGAYGNLNFYRYFNLWFGSTLGVPYDWTVVSQRAYSDAGMTQQVSDINNTVNLYQGQKTYIQIKIKNTGAEIWNQNTIKLGTSHPNDRTSVFQDTSWLSNNRVAFNQEASVAPGETATYNFSMTAPQQLGSYQEYFTPIFDGVAWFRDLGLYYTINVNFQLPQGARTALAPGDSLAPGQQIYSPDGRYSLKMQADGNLVIYSQYRALWGSGTNGKSVAGVYMQADGNLVIYDTAGKPLWGSGTNGKSLSTLYMQTDGNLVTYNASGATWGSGTNGQN